MHKIKYNCYLHKRKRAWPQVSVQPIFSPNQIAVFLKFEFLFHEDRQDTDVWKYCVVCLKKNRLDTKMLRVHLFSFFTINTAASCCACALGI